MVYGWFRWFFTKQNLDTSKHAIWVHLETNKILEESPGTESHRHCLGPTVDEWMDRWRDAWMYWSMYANMHACMYVSVEWMCVPVEWMYVWINGHEQYTLIENWPFFTVQIESEDIYVHMYRQCLCVCVCVANTWAFNQLKNSAVSTHHDVNQPHHL